MLEVVFRYRGNEDTFDSMAQIDEFVHEDSNFRGDKKILLNDNKLFAYFICMCLSYGRLSVKVRVHDPDTYMSRTAMIDDSNFILCPYII